MASIAFSSGFLLVCEITAAEIKRALISTIPLLTCMLTLTGKAKYFPFCVAVVVVPVSTCSFIHGRLRGEGLGRRSDLGVGLV